jgi:hypothetical protein
MPFNPPGIIGGGQILSPVIQNDPFKGINDAITRARDRKLKDKALQLEAYQLWQKDEQEGRTTAKDFKTWYNEDYGAKNTNQSQASLGGFFNMIGDVAGAGLEGIGRIGKGLFEQGKRTGLEEVQANLPPDNDPNYDPGTPANDPMKVQRQTENENKGKFKKWLEESLFNQKTNENEFKQDTPLVYNPDYQEPEERDNIIGKAGSWLKKNVFTGKGWEGEGGGSGQGPLQKAPESEYQKRLHSGTAQGRDSYAGPYAPDYQEGEQWKGRPSPELNSLQRAGNWMKENVFNQQGFEGEGGGSGVGPLQKTPESEYQKRLHQGTTQDPYGFGNKTSKSKDAPYYDFDNASDIKSFQADHMGMVEGDPGFGTYGPRTQAKRKEMGYERGGKVPGNRTGDKNKAYLEDGEYVLNRNAVKGIGKGFLDWINDERYPRFQSGGGFQAPHVITGAGLLIDEDKEKVSESAGAGDMASMVMDYLPMILDGMQRGGHVPGYQVGGYHSPGYQNRREMEQLRMNEQAMGDFRRARDRYDVGVNQQQIEMDKYEKDLSSGMSGAALWFGDLMTPDWATGPALSWATGMDIQDIDDIPRAIADKSKSDYSRDYMREEMEAPFPEGVRPTAAMLAEKQAYAGTPTASTATRLSNDALYKKLREASGNFNALDFLREAYGDNWANSLGN